MSVAVFNSVEIDAALRKKADQDIKTLCLIMWSNPHILDIVGYGVKKHESLDIWAAIEKSNNQVGVLTAYIFIKNYTLLGITLPVKFIFNLVVRYSCRLFFNWMYYYVIFILHIQF